MAANPQIATVHTELASARAATAAREAEVRSATEAADRARQAVQSAESEVTKRSREQQAWIERQARRMVAHARDGKGPIPTLTATNVELLQSRTAEATLEAARKAVKELESAEQAARAALAAAHKHEQALLDDATRGEAHRIATRLTELRTEERELAARLTVLAFDGRSELLTEAATAAIEDPPPRPGIAVFASGGPVLFDIHSPIQGGGDALAAARAHWQEFEQSLLTAVATDAAA